MRPNDCIVTISLLFATACPAESDGPESADGSTGQASSTGTPDAESTTSAADDSTGDSGDTEASTGADESTSGSTGAPDTSGCGNVLYLNFDGATMSVGGQDATMNSTSLPSFEGELAPYGGNQREAVTARIVGLFAAYDLCIFDQRPADGDYTMVVFTDTTPEGFSTVVGIGGTIDCSNLLPNNVVFGLSAEADGVLLANGVAHALGISYGLTTVDTPQCPTPAPCGDPEIMVPVIDNVETRTFTDQCWNTASPGCTSANAEFCNDGGQNSHQYLLDVLGPAPG